MSVGYGLERGSTPMHFTKANLVTEPMIPIPISDELTLEQVELMLSQEHDRQTVIELTRNFCLQTSSKEISKTGMEFLYMHGCIDDLQVLINKNMESTNESNRKWARAYQIMIDRRRGRYSLNESLLQAESIETEEPELTCIIEFIKVSIYYGQNEFGKLGNFLAEQQYLFEKIEDNYLMSFFYQRLNQQLFIYYLSRNEVIMARKHAFRALNQVTNPQTIVDLHTNLGLSYIHDTYFQGMYHFSEALKLSKSLNMQDSITSLQQYNIPFISAHFKRVEGITTIDKSEQAHIEIAKGNYAKAEAILSKVQINSPFKMYYLGLARQDKNILLQSYNQFIEQRSDYFFSRLPLKALNKI